MPQAFAGHIGDGGMGKKQLSGRQARLQGLRAVHPAAKKSQLKTIGCVRTRQIGPAGDVPPLGLEIGMGAGIARKFQFARHGGPGASRASKRRPSQRGHRCRCSQQLAAAGRAQARGVHQLHGVQGDLFHYQSSFTAITASRPAAAWPESQAVKVPANTTDNASASSRSQGRLSSMLQ